MTKQRLDQAMVGRGLVATRSQAENYIKLGYVEVDGRVAARAGFLVSEQNKIQLTMREQYVSRAALKLASVADKLNLNFKNKVVLDVGSSTGGFTDFALRRGAKKILAVDVGAGQMHETLRARPEVELYEQTDIRSLKKLPMPVDIVVVDVSFISLREVLPPVAALVGKSAAIVAMCKPQFEAGSGDVHKGVVKNNAMRRKILKDFENWAKKYFKTTDKADSEVAGTKGNLERFYLLKII